MKKILILTISFYQNLFSYLIKNILGVSTVCRFDTSCSEYARTQILKKGVLKGGTLSLRRLLSCQPFYHGRAI